MRKTLKDKKHYFVLVLVTLGMYKHLPLYVVGFEVYCDVVFVLQRFSDISRLMFLIFHCYCWPSLLFQQRPCLGSRRILVMCSVKVCFSALIFTQVSSIYLKVAGVLARWLCVSIVENIEKLCFVWSNSLCAEYNWHLDRDFLPVHIFNNYLYSYWCRTGLTQQKGCQCGSQMQACCCSYTSAPLSAYVRLHRSHHCFPSFAWLLDMWYEMELIMFSDQ